MKKLNHIPSATLPALALVVIACLLLLFEKDLLWKLEEENLFLNSSIFFKEQMLEPGGFLSWAGCWLTQFFFYPWLGVLWLCAWWGLLMWLIKRTFRVSQRWLPVTVIPVLFLLVTIVDMGYWVYILKLKGHVFVATLGTTAAVALLWAFRCLVEKVHFQPTLLRCVFVLLVCAAGYPLLGIYALGATVLMAVWIWRLEPRRLPALAVSLTAVASAWLLPLFYYHCVYYQTNLANIYVVKLPLYFIQEEYTSYYVPFVLLLLFFLAMAISTSGASGGCSRWRNSGHGGPMPASPNKASRPVPAASPAGAASASKHGKDGKHSKNVKRSKPLLSLLPAVLLLLAAALYTAASWYKDENFHHELVMERCIDQLDWDGVLEEAAKQEGEPTRAIVMMRNLALARLGRQGDEMYHYRNGCKKCNAPFDIRAINSAGVPIYYHLGMPNYSYRLCMERGVEFGWRAEQLKYMIRCSIINGEMKLARKYLRLLKQTMFHGTWADQYWQLTEHPEDIAKSPEMEFITHMMHYDNKLTADQNLVETFLSKHLVFSNYMDDPIFLEQAIYASMAAKNAKLFFAHLYNYSILYPDRPWPIHVQEAACLFASLMKNASIEGAPISPAVKESLQRFMSVAPRYEGQSAEAVQEALRPTFGNTYFFDYYLVNFPAQN